MGELISGKEAKLAWAEGVDVQVATGPDKFRTLVSSDDLGIFDCGNYFRLKPRTVNLNGIEVPKPNYFVDAPRDYDGRWEINIGGTYLLYKSRKDHDAVVDALRSVFGKK